MDKRYQVFISSTYVDLKDERRNVFQALMEMDCIPAGMELFPASDDDQWEFIKRIIDDCDYYILIVGGRYGSMNAEGISYTEKEFDYAVERGLKVIALVHEDPANLPVSKSDMDPNTREKLDFFRKKVSAGRLIKFWSSPTELTGAAVLSLTKTIKLHPAVGWVRPTGQATNEVLTEVNELRKQNELLRSQLQVHESNAIPNISDIAGLDDMIDIVGTESYIIRGNNFPLDREWKITLTWQKLFGLLAPYLIEHPHQADVKVKMARVTWVFGKFSGFSPNIDDQLFQTISIQFKVLGLVNIDYLKTTSGHMSLFWSLTNRGNQLMLNERVVRAAKNLEG